MQKKRNIALIILLIALTVLSLYLNSRGIRSERLTLEDTYFSVPDTARIEKVVILSDKISNSLVRNGRKWRVNDKYNVDPSMRTVLLTVLNRIRPQRPVPRNMLADIKDQLTSGTKVEIFSSDGLLQTYLAGGNGISVSYFMKEGEDPYIVHLPGYDSYVSGIFEVSENDWRDRFVFSTNWIGLKELSLDYPGNKIAGFSIETMGNSFNIPGITNQDTTALMEYIDIFQVFMVDQYISRGSNPKYDSLFNTSSFAILKVDDTSFDKPLEISFYHIPHEPQWMLCRIGDQPAILSQSRIKPIFKKKTDFIKSD